jgi:ABC-2 type transport system ATP-binding protein
MTWEIVRELAEGGTTLLLTTQYLEEADQLAGRVAVIDGGAVIAEGPPDRLKSAVGGEHLEIVLAAGADADAAIVAVKPFATGSIQAWPMQHPELAVLCWSVGMLLAFAPLAVHLYRRKALG